MINKDIIKYLEKLKENGYVLSYTLDNDYIALRYGLSSVRDTEITINCDMNININEFLNAISERADNIRYDIYNSLTDETDFFGYSSNEELEERIQEESDYLKLLANVYKEVI